ncbi:MAG TPA: M14 family metallopeptidase [Blastocatellia bacterium]|nr:M14 family metallopeptidase [Blastocatellia bacterium]HMZ17005.1 M14 family metallopeptidase [Blastocatellia bacterium]HNG29966.1 M14 family metallopeptidase [Blastocatellia bacterium]
MRKTGFAAYLPAPPLCLMLLCLIAAGQTFAQNKLTSPKEHFGFDIGDDYQLANYTQYEAYIKKLDQESERMKVIEIGKSAEGRTMYVGIITAPENFKKLDRYKEISRKLALAEGLTNEQARQLAKEGKAIVWIDGGLHATEVLGAQQLIETVWQLNSRTDEEALRFLNDTIVLTCLVNPDGMELVSNWYMREQDPLKRNTSSIPRLYQKYIGHDNNRDFYMSAQPESEAINRVFYHEWFPQIIYNHHQTGPAGTVMFAPPFRDPFNYNFDPLIPIGIDLVAAAMHNRFIGENKPGVTMRSGSSYSTWWNGGLRTTVYFHNMIGLLTETIGNPTPMEIPLVLRNQLPRADLPYPIAPQKWHFRQSIDYSTTANWAVLDVASKHREDFLFNLYRMGKNSIDRGSRDSWTLTPQEIAQAQEAFDKERQQGQRGRGDGDGDGAATGQGRGGGGGFGRGGVPMKYYEMLRTPERRDPRGYIIPANQPDFLTAAKFINALVKTGITIHRATGEFQINGKSYPAGSYVVKTAQAFRPHVLDMFEPQDHPNDFQYPGGPPIPPYDNAGWTLAYQMGVKFDRILDGFDGPFEKLSGQVKILSIPPTPTSAAGYLLSHEVNDSFIATNRLLKSGEEVYWVKQSFSMNGKTYPAGTIFVPSKSSTLAKIHSLQTELGLRCEAAAAKPAGEMFKLKAPRIALWDRYGGSMPSGWTRWILEQFEFPFTVVYPQTLDAGNLADKFDVIIFVTGGIPAVRAAAGGGGAAVGGDEPVFGRMPRPEELPEEFRGWLGNISTKTVSQLKTFIEGGGTVLTIGTSTNLAYHLGLPMASALVEKTGSGDERPLSRDKYYIPGSILQVSVDNSNPLAYGLPDKVDVFFDNSPVFRLKPEASLKGIKPVAWFSSDKPLRSGWAWGQKYLQDGVAVIDAGFGKGKLFLYGPEIAFRAQPHGTFKLLFNGIYYGRAETVK